ILSRHKATAGPNGFCRQPARFAPPARVRLVDGVSPCSHRTQRRGNRFAWWGSSRRGRGRLLSENPRCRAGLMPIREGRMYYQIGAGDLYRVTKQNTIWPEPVQGLGAFYTPKGGSRYNEPHQQTVSCSEDPLVAITEAAFYQALRWRDAIASSLIHAVTY